MFHIDVVEKFNEVDLGNNQLYVESKGKIMQTAIFFIVVAVAGLSLLSVFAFRYRRGSYNTLVLKESNQKLDGLLWILTSQFYPELLNDVSGDQVQAENSRDRLHRPVRISEEAAVSVSRRLSQYSKRANKHGHRKLLQNLISIDTSDPSVLQDLEPRDGLAIRANPLRTDKEVELGPLGKTSSQQQAALRQRWLADNQHNNAADNQSVANNKSDYDSEDEETFSENIKQEDEFQKEVDKILDRVSNLDFGDNVSNKDIQE